LVSSDFYTCSSDEWEKEWESSVKPNCYADGESFLSVCHVLDNIECSGVKENDYDLS